MNKLQLFSLVGSISLILPSCMTTYDRNGQPVQSVDPGLATVAIVGAGLLGAALASDNHHEDHYSSHQDYYYQPEPCYTEQGHGGHGHY